MVSWELAGWEMVNWEVVLDFERVELDLSGL